MERVSKFNKEGKIERSIQEARRGITPVREPAGAKTSVEDNADDNKAPITPPTKVISKTPVSKATEQKTPVAPTPPAPTETKIKIAGKEYTQAQLEEIVNGKQQQQQTPPVQQQQQTPPVQQQQNNQQNKEIETKRNQWKSDFQKLLPAKLLDPKAYREAISKDKDYGLGYIESVMKQMIAEATLLQREASYKEFNQALGQIDNAVKPVISEFQIQREKAAEVKFLEKNADLKPNIALVRQVASSLIQHQAGAVSKLGDDEFFDEVAKQTRNILTN